jgi:23S rRNA pseudouridine1911/1915/1917 synthase
MIDIIHEDEELLVINKPAGLVCHPTKSGEYSSLIGRVRLYLASQSARHEFASTSAHLVNRLDRETSGVVIVAKSARAAGGLGKIWETRAVRKEYRALVHGHLNQQHGMIDAALGKDETSAVAIKDCVRPDGTSARTEYWLERLVCMSVAELTGETDFEHRLHPAEARDSQQRDFSLVRLHPHTGRKHQIRIHLASEGYPIVGDKLYGGDEDLYLALVQERLTPEQKNRLILPNHALHASEVRFVWRGAERIFQAERPDWLLKAEQVQQKA